MVEKDSVPQDSLKGAKLTQRICCEGCGAELLSVQTQFYKAGVLLQPGRATTCFGTVLLEPAHTVILWALLKGYPDVVRHDSLKYFYDTHLESESHKSHLERESYGGGNIIAVQITRVRKAFLQIGLSVEVVWSIGYKLTIPRVVLEGAIDVSPAT